MIYSYIRMLSIFVFIHICHWKDTVYQALPSLVNFFEESIQIEEPADSTVRNSNYSYLPHNSINVCTGCLSLSFYLGHSTEWRDLSREPRGQGNPEIRETQRSGEPRGQGNPEVRGTQRFGEHRSQKELRLLCFEIPLM